MYFDLRLRLIGLSGAFLPALLAACPALTCALLSSDLVRGVLLLTLRDGLQYWLPLVFAPHGLPVRVSVHFSRCHRFRLLPASVLRTCPFSLRHRAMACDARADGNVLYDALTFL